MPVTPARVERDCQLASVSAHARSAASTSPNDGLKASTLAARGLRVIAYDARGHGRSGFFTRERDYDHHMLAGELLGCWTRST